MFNRCHLIVVLLLGINDFPPYVILGLDCGHWSEFVRRSWLLFRVSDYSDCIVFISLYLFDNLADLLTWHVSVINF